MTPEQLDQLKAKIVEANPAIREHHDRCMNCGYGFEYCKKLPATDWGRPACIPNVSYDDCPIRLADVLLAVDARWDWGSNFYCGDGIVRLGMPGDPPYPNLHWNLRADSLDDQDDDTHHFLFDLLCSPSVKAPPSSELS